MEIVPVIDESHRGGALGLADGELKNKMHQMCMMTII